SEWNVAERVLRTVGLTKLTFAAAALLVAAAAPAPVTKGGPRLRVPMPERTMMTIALSANGQRLAVAPQDRTTVKVWDVTTGKETAEFQPQGGYTWSLAFAPDGKTLAAGVGQREDNTPGVVILWDVIARKERATLPGHVGTVSCVAFAPDSKTL